MLLRKHETLDVRTKEMLESIKAITLATNDIRWCVLKEGNKDQYDILTELCENLETCVKQATDIVVSSEMNRKPVKKTMLSIFG
jgi:hypothetical protein